MDISPIQNTSATIIRKLLQNYASNHVKLLNLSGTKAISDSEVIETLGSIQQDVRDLYILDKPNREADNPLKFVTAMKNIAGNGATYRKFVLRSIFRVACASHLGLGQKNLTFPET